MKQRSQIGEADQREPYHEVVSLLEHIINLPLKKRFFDLKDDKFCYLDEFEQVQEKPFFRGVIESARSAFRPKLINKSNGQKRVNPRELSEGDIDRTHFFIGIYPSEVKLFIEYNYSGVRVQNFVNYLKHFLKPYSRRNHIEVDYSILHLEVAPVSFMTQLESAIKSSRMELYMDKQILGTSALNFSDRTVAVKRDVVLSVAAKRNEDIKTLIMDVFASFNDSEKGLRRLRVFAKNQDNHDVIIDTQALCMKSVFVVDVNEDTGELNTSQVYRQMQSIAEAYL